MAYRIQFRRDTAANWKELNDIMLKPDLSGPGLILNDGEIGYIMSEPEFDENGKLLPSKSSAYKIGDGVNHWGNLNEFGFNGNWADDIDGHEDGDDQMAVSKKLLVDKFEEILTELTDHDGQIDNHKIYIETLQKFANEYKPIIDQLSTDSGAHADAIEALDKVVNGWEEVETETDGDGGETEIITRHPGLVDRVEALESSHEFVTEDEFKMMETNHALKEGIIYFTYAVEEAGE